MIRIQDLKDRAGVYGIWVDNKYIVYIGKSLDLYRRFNQHKHGVSKYLKELPKIPQNGLQILWEKPPEINKQLVKDGCGQLLKESYKKNKINQNEILGKMPRSDWKYVELARAKQNGHRISFKVIKYVWNKNAASLKEIEKEYIERFKPPLNMEYVRSKPVPLDCFLELVQALEYAMEKQVLSDDIDDIVQQYVWNPGEVQELYDKYDGKLTLTPGDGKIQSFYKRVKLTKEQANNSAYSAFDRDSIKYLDRQLSKEQVTELIRHYGFINSRKELCSVQTLRKVFAEHNKYIITSKRKQKNKVKRTMYRISLKF